MKEKVLRKRKEGVNDKGQCQMMTTIWMWIKVLARNQLVTKRRVGH